jgi:O-antigen ligase
VYTDIEKKWIKVIAWIAIAAISVYLHILAARTGLAIWYLFVVCWCLRFAFKKNLTTGILIILALVVSSVLAAKYIPTLEKKVWYMRHTYELFVSGKKESGYSDMGRYISYSIAYNLIKTNPIIGVGAGDVLYEMERGYERMAPDVPVAYRLIPHNQFLVVCLACGIFALVVFLAWTFRPLVWIRKNPNGFYLFIIWLSLVLAMMVEPMLEIQFGVFVFMFYILWSRHSSVLAPATE